MKLTSSQKGEIAKLKVEQRAVEKGWVCSRTIESARYDLVLDDGARLYRVQVKYADGIPGHNTQGAVMANLRSNRGDDRNLKYRRRKQRMYTPDEIDAVLVFIPRINEVCWFGPDKFHGKSAITIRYESPKNGQEYPMASDFKW